MDTSLDQLKRMTVVVADTGDFNTMREYTPRDATTNPTLIVKAIQKSDYANLLTEVLAAHKGEPVDRLCDQLLVRFGCEILKIIPGRVSTEVDARLSYDTDGTVARAQRLIEMYAKQGVTPERILIKTASTWEGIKAAERLERDGIHCNLTLLFGFAQAAACADAGVTLISPFVGRIFDWYKKRDNKDFAPEEDPGVLSVRKIYAYYKKFNYPTEVMGASFRSVGQVLALAGCDLLTISPELLGQLAATDAAVTRKLEPDSARDQSLQRQHFNERDFRTELNDDAMAYEKLGEGIRLFVADALKLEKMAAGA